MALINIRPKNIFSLELDSKDKFFTIPTPPSEIGTILTLESALLSTIIKYFNVKNIFEIGTYNGYSTSVFALNSQKKCQIISLDLPYDEIEIMDKDLNIREASENDQYLKQVYKEKKEYFIDLLDEDYNKKIKLLKSNSLNFNPIDFGLINSQDFIFIDGGHDYEVIKNDTIKALDMASVNSVIVWHDYGSDIHTDVKVYIDELAKDNDIYIIGATMLAVMFTGDFKLKI